MKYFVAPHPAVKITARLPKKRGARFLLLLMAVAGGLSGRQAVAGPAAAVAPVDVLVFGNDGSEQGHALKAVKSETLTGGLGEPARRLLAGGQEPWEGGSMSFTMKVDPREQNYFTARFWGSETGNNNHLVLYCEGKQVGYLHLGDVEALDSATDSPPFQGRFFYNTCPLPQRLTKGKTELACEIRSLGPIWGYGANFAQYQKPMTEPTRGIYKVYTHVEPCYEPAPDEKQGPAPVNPPKRSGPGEEEIGKTKDRLNGEIRNMLGQSNILNQHQIWFLARAYHVKWSEAYHNDQLVKKVTAGLDALYLGWVADPATAENGPAMYNAGWFGLGPAGAAVSLLAEPLRPLLDTEIGAKKVTRRAGWSAMLQASRDWHLENRREYSNQSMINDTYGVYLSNRGVEALEPDKAMPEAQILHFLYQSAGIEPWLGSLKAGQPLHPLGDQYYQLTQKGLTKELGFVGYYGEVLDWLTAMYNATRPAPGQPGDQKIAAQLEKAARARAAFRYPELDPDGNRALLAETIIGWRDQGHYPGNVTYGQRPTWDASPVDAAAATLDPYSVGYAQQMLGDNQFFVTQQDKFKAGGLRILAGVLDAPDGYELLKAQPPSPHRLPMSDGEPDFVFSDEEDGCVAIKHGHEILYASLYWRARTGINFLARVHYITPRVDRIAVVSEETTFTPSGLSYTRPDWTNMGFGNGGLKYPGDWHSALAGEEMPIAKVPAGVAFKPGMESPYAGKGDFYTMRYGPYMIAMNMTKDQSFELKVPEGAAPVRELVSGRIETPGSTEKIGPRSTMVLHFGEP